MPFNKSDLVSHVMTQTSVSKAVAEKTVEACFSGISQALQEGQEVRFIGFGSFLVQKLAARQGRNPRTGEVLDIPATNKPIFRAGIELKKAVNPE